MTMRDWFFTTHGDDVDMRKYYARHECAMRDAYAAGMERAAEICEAQGRMAESIDGNSFYIALGQAANAIRAETKGE